MLNRRKILCVDDEIKVISTLKAILESEGFDVSTAYDGLEALHEINKAQTNNNAFDLLLLDIFLPKINGLELYDLISDYKYQILFITGYGRRDIANEFKSRGLSPWLEKPFTFNQLMKAINEKLEDE